MDDYVTVFDLIECGYRSIKWFLILAGILLVLLVYIVRLKPDSRGEKIYRSSVAACWILALGCLLLYHYYGYSTFKHYAQVLRSGKALQTAGAITFVQAEGYFLYFDIDGKRFRCSSSQRPYYLGMHPADFPLKPTFLVRVFSVDDVIVRLQVHRTHLEI